MSVYESALERGYNAFSRSHPDMLDCSKSDFTGIQFSESAGEPLFRVYYKYNHNTNERPDFLEPFHLRNMIRMTEKIADSIEGNVVQYEVGLKNRTLHNMRWAYHWLEEHMPWIGSHYKEICRMKQIKVSDVGDYGLAALFFLGIGMKADTSDICSLKLYYLTRKCPDPERIEYEYRADNEAYLLQIRKMRIPKLEIIASFLEEALDRVSYEMWMTGADYHKSGKAKYKIYIKMNGLPGYRALINGFEKNGCSNLSRQLGEYLEWITKHLELKLYGVAVCLTDADEWSVNFYH